EKPRRRQRGEASEGAIPGGPSRGPGRGATPAEPHPRNGRSSPRFPLQKPAANRRAFREATMHFRLLTVLTVTTLALSTQPVLSQQPSGFDASRFDWTDPQNWERVMNPSGTQTWTLHDQAARAYLRHAVRRQPQRRGAVWTAMPRKSYKPEEIVAKLR